MKFAARLMKSKLSKYELHFTNPVLQLGTVLDPRFANKMNECNELKDYMKEKSQGDYGVLLDRSETERSAKLEIGFHFLASDESEDRNNTTRNEIKEFFTTTLRLDRISTNFVGWWKREGLHRYPNISKRAHNCLMAMGSSVPSVSAFQIAGT